MPLNVVNKLPKPASIPLESLRCTDTFLLADSRDRDTYMYIESVGDEVRVLNLTGHYPTMLSRLAPVTQVAATLTVTECLTVALNENEQVLIRAAKRIEAIKALRERCPMLGLREAKMLVDAEASRMGC